MLPEFKFDLMSYVFKDLKVLESSKASRLAANEAGLSKDLI